MNKNSKNFLWIICDELEIILSTELFGTIECSLNHLFFSVLKSFLNIFVLLSSLKLILKKLNNNLIVLSVKYEVALFISGRNLLKLG